MRHLRAGLAGLFVIGSLTVGAAPAEAAPPEDLCAGMQRIALPGPDMCTRGPDNFPGMHPAKPNKPLPGDVARAQVLANPVVCDGDGVSGKRVEVMYAREQGQASRYGKFLPTLRAWSHEIDAAINDSAAQTGASRHIRWITEPVAGGCQVKVIEVVLPVGALQSWEAMIPALQNAGFNRSDRKYAVYADADKICGVATLWGDDRPGLDNANNVNNGYARVDYGCWGFNAMGHELGHNFGAVQSSAPNYNGHCKDEWDLMCYGSDTTVVCTNKDQDRLWDCNHDDYFHTNPPSGSYLATHWNVARSDWLIKSTVPDPRDGPRHGQAFVLTNVGTGNAVDVVDGSVDNLAYLSHRAPSGAASQRWRFVYETGWLLQNINSSKCADSAFSGTEPGTQILQYNCNGQQGMRWNLYPLPDGSYGVLNTLTGHAVTDSGAYPEPLQQQPFNETAVPDTQKWRLVRAPLPDGLYRIKAEVGGHDLDVVDCHTEDGADVRIWYRIVGSPCQRWQVTSVDGGTVFKIVDSNSGKGLDVAGCSTADAAIVHLWPYGGGDCQQWRIEPISNGAYKVIGVGSQKSLDVAGCNPAAGADVIIWPFHGGTCQRWYFDPI